MVPGLAAVQSLNLVPAMAVVQSFMAFDYGQRRVGVATGNSLLQQAQPLTTIAAEGEARFAMVARLLQQWQPDALVVGVPFHPDGQAHDNTRAAQRFARQLRGRFGLTVHEVDERYTTTEALAAGAADADAAAAAIILNQYLNPVPRSAPGPDAAAARWADEPFDAPPALRKD
jgi:putative holliday junction resolvase